MKTAILFLIAIFLAGCTLQNAENLPISENSPIANPNPQPKQAVLVELFTSEGCSSCPPADKTLAFLEKEQPAMNAEIITLSLHVDYWDYLGWKDEFSSADFSERQTVYADKLKLDSTYTPQMVVDGRTQLVGSDTGKAVSSIMEAAKAQKAKIELSNNEKSLKINISDIPTHEDSSVFMAVAENNLVSKVKRGENSGRVLEHISVVRELREIGKITSSDTKFSSETALQIQSNWKKENVKIVVFVQENDSRKILGVNQISIQ
jgi:hypothetical protein